MPTRFLDLSDELIRHIGFFLHDDNAIPMPSFSPHWANFNSAINKDVAKHYLKFREVCPRIAIACPLQGLHLVLKDWKHLLKWLNVPESVLRGIRRVCVIIERPSGRNIHALWTTLQNFLWRLPNLQELKIYKTPMCRHSEGVTTLELLPITTNTYLPKLESLSFELTCKCCSEQLPKLFIPGAPKLRHLKLCQPVGIRAIPYITDHLLHPATHSHGIQTLYIKIGKDLNTFLDTLDDIARRCSDLKDLTLSTYDGCDLSSALTACVLRDTSSRFAIDTKLSAEEKVDMEARKWKFVSAFSCERTLTEIDGIWLNLGAVRFQETLLTCLSSMSTLESIDISLTVEDESLPFMRPTIAVCRPFHEYRRDRERIESYETQYTEAVEIVAQTLIDHTPSLRRVTCWEASDAGYHTFLRWEWEAIGQRHGERQVILKTESELLMDNGEDLTYNDDGDSYPSHRDESESDGDD
ncbi:hypothetical protein IAT40_007765 [Kwoniella sp. CBS 6097]